MPRWLPPIALLAAVLACFGRAAGHEFVLWDDNINVTDNPLLSPPSWAHLVRAWSGPWAGLYVPVSYTVFMLEAWVSSWTRGALDPRVFHLGTILLHLGCAWVVLRILRRIVADDRTALLGALLFAIHPLQTESVAWVTETRGVLAALFGLLATERLLARRRALATLFFVLALLSKPSAVSIPLIAGLIDVVVLRRPWKEAVPVLALWMALALALVLLTKSQQASETIRFVPPIAERPRIALDALAFYLGKLVVPTGLAADHGRTPARVMAEAPRWLALVPVLAAGALASLPGRRTWLGVFGICVAGTLPVLGLVPFAYQDVSTVADRYVYLAMLGPALALALVVARGGGHLVTAAAVVLLGACAIASFRQTGHWRDTETLFARTLEVNPRSHVAYDNIGLAQQMRGQIEDAEASYRAAIAVEPAHPIAYNNIGLLRLRQGRLDEAIALFRDALEREPGYARAHANLGVALFQQGKADEGETELRESVRLRPDDFPARVNLGNVLLARGRTEEAVAEYEAALDLFPRSADAHAGLATAYAKLGRPQLSAEHATVARELRRGP